MSSKTLFASKKTGTKFVPLTNTINNAGGIAYALSDKEALAQFVVAGFLGGTYYASAENELSKVLELAAKCPPEFVAKAAIYSRSKGKMVEAHQQFARFR